MFKITKEDIYAYLFGTLFCLLLFIGFLYCTNKENAFIGLHDSQHEGHNCNCHIRLSK